MAGTAEYEELNKNLEIVDGHAVKAPEDYQDPEQLYHVLIERVRKYHPSADYHDRKSLSYRERSAS